MKTPQFASDVFVDVGSVSLKAARGEQTCQIALTREPSGMLTPSARDAATKALTELGGHTALVGLPARGISVRRFDVPPVGRETVERVLALSIEQAFPMKPRELAWGYRLLPEIPGREGREALVLAVRQEALAAWREVFIAAGMQPTFTVGAIAAANTLPGVDGVRSVLDIGRSSAELLTFTDGVPTSVRTLAWGGDAVTQAVADATGLDLASVEARKLTWDRPVDSATDETGRAARDSIRPLETALRHGLGQSEEHGVHHVHLAGGGGRLPGLAVILQAALGDAFKVHEPDLVGPAAASSDERPSAVLRGLAAVSSDRAAVEPIVFLGEGAQEALEPSSVRKPRIWTWVGVAALLLVSLLAVRYVPALRRIDGLRTEVAASEADLAKMPDISKELAFYEYVESQQTPAVGAISAIAHVVPTGGVLQAFSLQKRGGVLLEVKMKSKEKNAFRKRLVQSKWFADVRLEATKRAPKKHIIVKYSARLTPPPEGLDSIADELKTKAPDPTKVKPVAPTRSPRPAPPRPGASIAAKPTSTKPTTTPAAGKGASKAAPPSVIPIQSPSSGPGPLNIKLPPGVDPSKLPPELLEALKARAGGEK